MRARQLIPTLAVAGACAFLGACGGDDKPAYCSDVDNFKDAISGLTSPNVAENGVSGVTTAVNKVQTSGKALVESAKSTFPTQTSALNTSLTALGATVKQLGNSSTREAAVRAIPAQAIAVNSAYQSLATAAKDKCD
jgi:hypothetical protein